MDDRELVNSWYDRRATLTRSFFTAAAGEIARACKALAEGFLGGGRLLAYGFGAAATDAQHVAVEFVHPVIVGKRALPAIALVNDAATWSAGAADHPRWGMRGQLLSLIRPGDVAIGIVHGPGDAAEATAALNREAAAAGATTIGLTGAGAPQPADHVFDVGSDDPYVVQEIQETLYHVMWELVHVFLEHGEESTDRSPGKAGFLYPFLDSPSGSADGILEEVAASVRMKAADVVALREGSCDPSGLSAAADAVSERLARGGKVLAFGNGGSATDAADLVTDLMAPSTARPGIPALSLSHDPAVVTAVANDVGFENVFARQVIAHGAPNDVAVAISTSGGSRNVLAAIEEARRRGMLTVGFAGYGGGRLRDVCDHCLLVDGDYVPRIQEAQATQYHCLVSLVERRLGYPPPAL